MATKPFYLTLNIDGEVKSFKQVSVPLRKRLEYVDLQKKWEDLTSFDYGQQILDQAEFVAGLFDDPAVTKDAILDGLRSDDADKLTDIVQHLMGIDPN